MQTLGILEKQSIHYTSLPNKSWYSLGPYQTQFIMTSYQADLKNLKEQFFYEIGEGGRGAFCGGKEDLSKHKLLLIW